MKLLIVALDDYKPAPGGIAELTHSLARGLVDLGQHVEVLSRDMEDAEAFDQDCAYPVHRLDLPEVSIRNPHGAYRAYRGIKDHIDRLAPDAVICNVLGHRGHFPALAASRSGVPFVLLAHGNELTQADRQPSALTDRAFWALARWKRSLALKRTDRVVCNSHFTESVVRSLGVAPSKTVVIHPGCDPSSIGSEATDLASVPSGVDPSDRRVLLTVGRLVPRKGIDRTIDAIERAVETNPDLLYVVAGDGPDRQRLEAMVEDKDLEDAVVFTGYVSDGEKHALYEAADVFVMASRARDLGPRTGLPRSYEGFGIVYLEAALHGLPSIAGRSGGIPDAVEDGVTGILVDPEDPQEIADAIQQLLDDPEKAARMGQAGRKRATQAFTWEKASSRLVTVIEELIG